MEHFLEIVKKIISPFPSTSVKSITCFFKQNGNQWVLKDENLTTSLVGFFQSLPEKDLELLLVKKQLLVLYCNPKMSCTFYQYKNREILLMFPDLYELLQSVNFLLAQAILAHEVGHIILNHAKKEISYMDAQVEADRYAWQIGFAEPLIRVLENEAWSEEIAERLLALRILVKI